MNVNFCAQAIRKLHIILSAFILLLPNFIYVIANQYIFFTWI